MECSRVWAMPPVKGETFGCKPIRAFVDKYIAKLQVHDPIIVDPFARNCEIGNVTNDLNPDTKAQYHLDSVDFLKQVEATEGGIDMVLFDPPYSPRQVKELYDGIGMKVKQSDTNRTAWGKEKDIIARILNPNGIVLSFNWNTTGMGKGRGFEIVEVLVVCHGACHNDTLCVAEKKSGAPTES